jgi:hypothetical protein
MELLVGRNRNYHHNFGVQNSHKATAGVSQRGHGLNSRSFRVGFVVDKVALGLVFLRVHQFPLGTVIPAMSYTHSFISHQQYII